MTTDQAVRFMLLMPGIVGRAKRLPVPEALRTLDLAPRHLSLPAYLQHDGSLTVSQPAERLEIAPTTVSLTWVTCPAAGHQGAQGHEDHQEHLDLDDTAPRRTGRPLRSSSRLEEGSSAEGLISQVCKTLPIWRSWAGSIPTSIVLAAARLRRPPAQAASSSPL
ncbi:hypothetical protein ACFV1N_46395 [Streptosporangium canum]|uniref:hypothetical protein n=1 Tax=Streptosporangium canum TaxID=324952 RepID=UPI0036C4ABF8